LTTKVLNFIGKYTLINTKKHRARVEPVLF
jgi:hypothetical protein